MHSKYHHTITCILRLSYQDGVHATRSGSMLKSLLPQRPSRPPSIAQWHILSMHCTRPGRRVHAQGGDGGGGGAGGPAEPTARTGDTERVAARLIWTGMLGTAAFGGALLAGVDLSRLLDLAAAPSAAPALAPLFGPLLLLDAALLGVPWRLPPALLAPPDSGGSDSGSSSNSGGGSSGSGGGSGGSGRPVDLDLLEASPSSPASLALALAVYQRSALVAPGAWGRPPLA
ncbi:MAG: hypothetical protein J3K34DRAFT_522491, partial [Monoraphidium minutum]